MTSATTIAERVAQMHATMAADPPAEPMGAFAREQAELAASAPAGIAAVGTVLPDAELLDVRGAATTMYAAAGSGASVLVFYRGAWCPYCNIALSAYQTQLLPQLTERGTRLVAISPQKPDGSLTVQQKHGLASRRRLSTPATPSPGVWASSPAHHPRPAPPSCTSDST